MPQESTPSPHFAMLQRAGRAATLLAVVAAALFIAIMNGAVAGGGAAEPAADRPAASRSAAPADGVVVADATFVRRDIVRRERIVAIGRACGRGCAGGAEVVVRESRERYWSRAQEMAPRCASTACVR